MQANITIFKHISLRNCRKPNINSANVIYTCVYILKHKLLEIGPIDLG